MLQIGRHPDSMKKCDRLADHDVGSLAEWLVQQTGCAPGKARRTALKALGLAFAHDASGDADWSDATLKDAQVGAWARPALLALSPKMGLKLVEQVPSADGTVRLALATHEGHLIESVIIPAEQGRDSLRTTLCLSSQAGCARACTFCETGSHGLTRQLSAGEIVDQYRIARRLCESSSRPIDKRISRSNATGPTGTRPSRGPQRLPVKDRPISNIVFMGMGEPFDNLDCVLKAIDLLTTDQTFGFASRRITVSTVGVADKLQRFFESTPAELAVSLNAPDDQRRSEIMPINKRWDMLALRDALIQAIPSSRRVLFQYALFAGFNDAPEDADLVADYVAPLRCRVNVIPANPGPDLKLVAPDKDRVDAFVSRLHSRGVTTLVRRPRGRDVGGACGQLAGSLRKMP